VTAYAAFHADRRRFVAAALCRPNVPASFDGDAAVVDAQRGGRAPSTGHLVR
jgi:hypothetical protein